MNRWGQVYLEMLQADNPKGYAELERAGTLEETAFEAGERAQEQFETLLAQMRRKDPGPEGALGQVQHLMTLDSQIRELVLADLYQPIGEKPDGPPGESDGG